MVSYSLYWFFVIDCVLECFDVGKCRLIGIPLGSDLTICVWLIRESHAVKRTCFDNVAYVYRRMKKCIYHNC